MFEQGDLLTLDGNKKFIVVDQLEHEKNKYVLLVSNDKQSNIDIFKLEDNTLVKVVDPKLLVTLLNLFNERNKAAVNI